MERDRVSGHEPEARPPATREEFQELMAKSLGGIRLSAWNEAVDWEHGQREMADFHTPLTGLNRLYLEWIYGRVSSLFNAVMGAAAGSHRDTWQESAIEMLFGRTIGDLQAIGFLIGKGYYVQAYSSARMAYECCDLADLYIQAGMPPNENVAAMLTNLNATFYVTLDFVWRKLEEITTGEERGEFERRCERLRGFLHADGETIARRVEQIRPA